MKDFTLIASFAMIFTMGSLMITVLQQHLPQRRKKSAFPTHLKNQ